MVDCSQSEGSRAGLTSLTPTLFCARLPNSVGGTPINADDGSGLPPFTRLIADEAPVDLVYLGEVVCGKRAPLFDAYFDRVVERLRAVMSYAYEHAPFYRAKWDQAGIHPDHVRSLEDFETVPVVPEVPWI